MPYPCVICQRLAKYVMCLYSMSWPCHGEAVWSAPSVCYLCPCHLCVRVFDQVAVTIPLTRTSACTFV